MNKALISLLLLVPCVASAQNFQTLDYGRIVEQAENAKTLRAQQELMREQAETERRQQALLRAQTAEMQQPAPTQPPISAEDQKASDIRFLKFLNQAGACQHLYSSSTEQSACMDKLKVSDPDFARTWAEAMTPGVESPALHAHRVELYKSYMQAQDAPGAGIKEIPHR